MKTVTGKIMAVHLTVMTSIILSLVFVGIFHKLEQPNAVDNKLKVRFTTIDYCEYIYVPESNSYRHLYTCKNHFDSKIPNIIWAPCWDTLSWHFIERK